MADKRSNFFISIEQKIIVNVSTIHLLFSFYKALVNKREYIQNINIHQTKS